MPVTNKNLFPGAYWYDPKKYERIGDRSGSPMWLIGWTGGRENSGEPLVTVAGQIDLDQQNIGAAELDALLSHGSMIASVNLTTDPYLRRENQQKPKKDDRYDRYRSPQKRK